MKIQELISKINLVTNRQNDIVEEYKNLLENGRLASFGTSDIKFWESEYRISFKGDFKVIIQHPHYFGFRSYDDQEADETDNYIHILHDMKDNCNGFLITCSVIYLILLFTINMVFSNLLNVYSLSQT